ncbi:MAG: hypothetical protein FJW38_19030 [Acidobacteria bacterium]|nr:hypothetical protein [Acidobacteriota bacterium]
MPKLTLSAILADSAGAVLKESLLIAEYPVTGISPAPRPRKATDTRFVTSNGPGIGTPCLRRSGGPIEIVIDVTRAVGVVDEEGRLKVADRLVRNGIISSRAALRIASAGQRVQPGGGARLDKVFLNGKELKPLTTAADQWSTEYVAEVPLEDVRFPERSLQRPAGVPVPRPNKLRIEIDAAGGGENWCATVAWAELSFSALAPVVLVHGNGQGDDGNGGEFWEGTVLDTSDKPREPIGTGGFVDAWKLQGVPYDHSISMLTDSTAAHGDLLARLIPDAAAAWGARHVHIVTHSKGGLDSRDFLARTIPPNFGVYSIHTIAGPHQGSAGPDYQIDAEHAWATHSDDPIRTAIGAQAPPNKGTQSLRVSETAKFNRENVPKLPVDQTVDEETHTVQYRSFSADMNLNDDYHPLTGNPVISHDETLGLPGQGNFPNSVWASVIQSCYRITGFVVSTYTETVTTVDPDTRQKIVYQIVREITTDTFQPNDVAVTQESSKVGPFQEIKHMDGNHSTIARPETADLVLESLRKIQPMKDPVE